MRWFFPLIILMLGIGGFVALWASKPQLTPLESQQKAWIVSVETISPGEMAPMLRLYGRVESPNAARLSAALNADVTSVRVLEGEQVRKGELLITLDDRDSELLIRQREAEVQEMRSLIDSEAFRHQNDITSLEQEQQLLELSRRAVKRAEDLAERNVGSKSTLDDTREEEARQLITVQKRKLAIREYDSRIAQLKARLARAEALRDLAQLDMERAQITAPFDGRITKVEVATGDRVRPGDPLIGLYDTRRVEIRAQIPKRYLPQVRDTLADGQHLRAGAEVDGQKVSAELERLSAEVVRGSGGVDGLFVVAEGDDWLQLGRTIELHLDLPLQSNVVALPLEAVYGTDVVYRLSDDRMHALKVERLGEVFVPSLGSRLLVRSPELESGDEIIITQLPNAMDGLRVRVADTAAN
jgi:RND family efflux transporter MFP subunit